MQETSPKLSPPRQDEEPCDRELLTVKAPRDRGRVMRALVVLGLVAFWAAWIWGLPARARETAEKTRTIQNLAGPIKTALMAYASEHQDHFPDASLAGEPAPQTSNQAFRRLFEDGYLNDETVFSIPKGSAKADGDISTPERILAKGENHYALAKGLTATSNAGLPLVWEAPLSGTWNPTWDSSRNRAEWGSTWSDGTVLVMTVGGSVATMKITRTTPDKKGPGHLAPTEKGQNPFQLKPDGDSLGPEW